MQKIGEFRARSENSYSDACRRKARRRRDVLVRQFLLSAHQKHRPIDFRQGLNGCHCVLEFIPVDRGFVRLSRAVGRRLIQSLKS